jgi:hypothetical protein
VNKKKQKNFINFWFRVVSTPREAEQKFFWFFFFQKKNLVTLVTFRGKTFKLQESPSTGTSKTCASFAMVSAVPVRRPLSRSDSASRAFAALTVRLIAFKVRDIADFQLWSSDSIAEVLGHEKNRLFPGRG